MSEQLLYTPEQAAELLQVKVSWLKRKASAGEIPHVKLAELRFRASDLEEIVAAGERRPQPDADVIPRRKSTTPQQSSARLAPVIEARPNARRTPRTA